MNVVALAFARHGRIGVATWIVRVVIVTTVASAAGLLAQAVAGDAGAAVVAALVVWSVGSLSARRLHDTGRSGWSMLAALVPVVGPLWVLFQLTRPGVEGRNRFGGDPEARLDYLQVDITR